VRRFLVPVACALLVACGGDGESIDPEADEERIEDALITLDDLPEGFTEGEADDDDSDNECNQTVLDIDEEDLDENEVAETDQVVFDSDTTQVRAQIESFRNDDLPQRVLDAIGDDEYVECLEEQVAENLDGGEIAGFEEVDTPVDGGRALQFELDLDGTPVVSQQHAALVDRFGITLVVTSVGDEIDDDLVEDLLDTMVERLEEDA
jgi:hypothetical protein